MMFKGVPKIDDAHITFCGTGTSEMRHGCRKSKTRFMQAPYIVHHSLSARYKTRLDLMATRALKAFVPLSGIAVSEASQFWSSIFQHNDVKLAAIRVSSPIPRHDDPLDVRDRKETFVCVRLAVRRGHVFMKKELGEHARRLIECPTPSLEAALIGNVLV
jgi:hypothetical protein